MTEGSRPDFFHRDRSERGVLHSLGRRHRPNGYINISLNIKKPIAVFNQQWASAFEKFRLQPTALEQFEILLF